LIIKDDDDWSIPKAIQGDILTTLLACAGISVDRPVGIATKQLKEMTNNP
jgi:hypothetical protein